MSTNDKPLIDRPLVSFLLVSYNQEEFIRQAVEGAFSQSYGPLEIVLSDDCSSDRTFAIIEEMAAAYKGPHKILLNRNSSNLGLSGHLNQAFKVCSGQLVVIAAGDDISMVSRTASLYKAWEAYDRPSMVCGGRLGIDREGQRNSQMDAVFDENLFTPGNNNLKAIRDYLDGTQFALPGAAAAYSKSLIDFRSLDLNVIAEDFSLCLRSLLLDGILCIQDDLVLYRWHGGNISKNDGSAVENFRKWSIIHAATFRCFHNDLKHFYKQKLISSADFTQIEKKIDAWVGNVPIMERWNQSNVWTKMLRLVPSLLVSGSKRHRRFAINHVIRTLKSSLGYTFWKRKWVNLQSVWL